MAIHPTAIIDPSARLGDVDVGPWAVVGPDVELADGVVVGAHAVIEAHTTIGEGTRLSPHVVLGGAPQDRKHDPSVPTRLQIGRNNVFREFATAHRGSSALGGVTVIGDGNTFMVGSHVAHDCTIGDGCVFANGAAVAGGVRVGDGAVLGGLSAVHQGARIGRLAMIGGGAMCAQDVPPFTIAQGDRARLHGLNILGLRRAAFDDEATSALKAAWRALFDGDLPRRTAISRVEETLGHHPAVAELLAFLRTSERGICRAGRQGPA